MRDCLSFAFLLNTGLLVSDDLKNTTSAPFSRSHQSFGRCYYLDRCRDFATEVVYLNEADAKMVYVRKTIPVSQMISPELLTADIDVEKMR